jgi:hypothetical protein
MLKTLINKSLRVLGIALSALTGSTTIGAADQPHGRTYSTEERVRWSHTIYDGAKMVAPNSACFLALKPLKRVKVEDASKCVIVRSDDKQKVFMLSKTLFNDSRHTQVASLFIGGLDFSKSQTIELPAKHVSVLFTDFGSYGSYGSRIQIADSAVGTVRIEKLLGAGSASAVQVSLKFKIFSLGERSADNVVSDGRDVTFEETYNVDVADSQNRTSAGQVK